VFYLSIVIRLEGAEGIVGNGLYAGDQ